MRFVNLYPPLLGAGIRLSYPKDDPYTIVVRMGLHWWNKNLFGTHFGGSLYAMCDPFFVFIVLKNLGPGLHRVGQGGPEGRAGLHRRDRCRRRHARRPRHEAALGAEEGSGGGLLTGK